MDFIKMMPVVLLMGAAIILRWVLLAIFYSSAFLAFSTMFALVFLEKGMVRLAGLIVRLQQ